MILIDGVRVIFGRGTPLEKEALGGIHLEVLEKEFVTVVGTNGSGKSTLFNAISGEISLTEGSVKMDGEEVSGLSAAARSKFIGRVFQDPSVGSCGDLTIAENLSLARKRGSRRTFHRCLSHSLKDEFRELVRGLNLNLENRLDTSMSLLSGGQRQAVSLLMATLSPLKLLLLDEPTSALDPKAEAKVLEVIQQVVSERGLTVMMVTHSLKQALQMGNRTIVVREGKITQDLSKEARAKLSPHDLAEALAD